MSGLSQWFHMRLMRYGQISNIYSNINAKFLIFSMQTSWTDRLNDKLTYRPKDGWAKAQSPPFHIPSKLAHRAAEPSQTHLEEKTKKSGEINFGLIENLCHPSMNINEDRGFRLIIPVAGAQSFYVLGRHTRNYEMVRRSVWFKATGWVVYFTAKCQAMWYVILYCASSLIFFSSYLINFP